MAEGKALEKIADSVWGRILPRAAMMFTALSVPFFGWLALEVYGAYKEDRKIQRELDVKANEKLDRITITLTTIDGTFRLMQSQIDNNERNAGSRFDAQGRRIDKLETKTDEMERAFRTYTR